MISAQGPLSFKKPCKIRVISRVFSEVKTGKKIDVFDKEEFYPLVQTR